LQTLCDEAFHIGQLLGCRSLRIQLENRCPPLASIACFMAPSSVFNASSLEFDQETPDYHSLAKVAVEW